MNHILLTAGGMLEEICHRANEVFDLQSLSIGTPADHIELNPGICRAGEGNRMGPTE